MQQLESPNREKCRFSGGPLAAVNPFKRSGNSTSRRLASSTSFRPGHPFFLFCLLFVSLRRSLNLTTRLQSPTISFPTLEFAYPALHLQYCGPRRVWEVCSVSLLLSLTTSVLPESTLSANLSRITLFVLLHEHDVFLGRRHAPLGVEKTQWHQRWYVYSSVIFIPSS